MRVQVTGWSDQLQNIPPQNILQFLLLLLHIGQPGIQTPLYSGQPDLCEAGFPTKFTCPDLIKCGLAGQT